MSLSQKFDETNTKLHEQIMKYGDRIQNFEYVRIFYVKYMNVFQIYIFLDKQPIFLMSNVDGPIQPVP